MGAESMARRVAAALIVFIAGCGGTASSPVPIPPVVNPPVVTPPEVPAFTYPLTLPAIEAVDNILLELGENGTAASFFSDLKHDIEETVVVAGLKRRIPRWAKRSAASALPREPSVVAGARE